jgi:hypothetical protein
MVGNQVYDRPISTHTAEVPRPIQRVETRLHQPGGIPNVMQPGRCYKIIRQCQLFGNPASAPGDRPDMPPSTWQSLSQHLPGQFSGFVNRDHILDRTSTATASPHHGDDDSTATGRRLTARRLTIGENYLLVFKGAYGASHGRPGSVLRAQTADTRRAGSARHPAITSRGRWPLAVTGGSVAAPFRAGALRTRRLPRAADPHPAATGAPPSPGDHACKSGSAVPSRRAPCHRAKITVKRRACGASLARWRKRHPLSSDLPQRTLAPIEGTGSVGVNRALH